VLLTGELTACCAVSVLGLGNLVGIGVTEQGYGPAVLNNSGGELAVVVVAHPLHVLEASQVRSSTGAALGQGSRLLGAEEGAVLPP
jgi:hypothetical protein